MQNRIVELSNSWRKAWNLACNSGSNQERPLWEIGVLAEGWQYCNTDCRLGRILRY